MELSQIYILLTILLLAVVAVFAIFGSKKKKTDKFTSLAGLAFAFILTGIIFSGDKIASYILISGGVILALVDIYRKSQKKR